MNNVKTYPRLNILWISSHLSLVLLFLLVIAPLSFLSAAPSAEQDSENAVDILTSIPPIEGIVRALVDEALSVDSLISGDPHAYLPSPSDALAVQNAPVLVLLEPSFEYHLGKLLPSRADSKETIILGETPSLDLLEVSHEHHHHGDEEHDDHDEEHDDHDEEHDDHDEEHDDHDEEHDDHDEEHDDHDEEHDDHDEEHDDHDEEHDDHDEAATGSYDYHIWLDPSLVGVVAEHLFEKLSALYPQHRTLMKENLDEFHEKLETIALDVGNILTPVQEKSFIVVHDGMQYFENAFGLERSFALFPEEAVNLSGKRATELIDEIESNDIKVMFIENQFSYDVYTELGEQLSLNTYSIDPLGITIDRNKDHYFVLITSLAETIAEALNN